MEERIQFSASDINFSPLEREDFDRLSLFSCGVKEIDDFFHDEVALCAKYHYLIPYKCFDIINGEILGLFTLANDILALEYEDKIDFPNLNAEYTDIFRRQSTYPAVNIGHLAVRLDVQSKGIGQIIVEFVAATFASYHLSGCQFITVDALNNARTLSFYQDKLGFELQTNYDYNKPTRRMYLDVIT